MHDCSELKSLFVKGTRPPPTAVETISLPTWYPTQPLTYRRIKEWIGECEMNHAKCNQFTVRYTPERLLHVSGDDQEPTVRLSTDHSTAHYATLSYCWGGGQPYKTPMTNLKDYQKNVPFSVLPKTIQDALIVSAFRTGK